MTHAAQLVDALRKPARKTRWSEKELQTLRDLYPVADTDQVASAIGRPADSVRKMAQACGIRKRPEVLASTRRDRALRQDANAGRFAVKHGLATAKNRGDLDPTYSTWLSMHQRCNYAGHKSFDRYGGRGIKVCERWSDFDTFRADMGERPAGMTIGRIDNDADYKPENCRWETIQQQQRNRSSNRVISAFGQSLPLCVWEERTGIRSDTISYRIRAGWTVDAALSVVPSNGNKWKVVRG